MAGATIDHMISLTILIAALLVAMMMYNGLFATAIDYDRNRQVANKAVDLINTICLSPGSPANWSETTETLLCFGLQDPQVGGYALSPYSIMRLNTDSQLVYYPRTGLSYNNISTNYGDAILTPIGNCVNYTAAAELLGVNGTYGFGVDVTPTLDVTVKQNSTASNLKLNITVCGSGMPLSYAPLNYYLFHVNKTAGSDFPSITRYPPGVAQTGSSGSVDIDFPIAADSVYAFVVYASLGGVTGVGYHANNTIADDTFVVPLIEGYDDDGYLNLTLAHSGEILNPSENATAYYNASFYTLTSDFHLQQYAIANSTGILKSGTEPVYNTTRIYASETGLLVISYVDDDGALGTVMVPWGVGALGVSASFGSSIGSGGYNFVATELRQVNIDGISYQVKVSAWSLSG